MDSIGVIGTHIWVRSELLDQARVQSELWINNLDYEKRRQLGYRAGPGEISGIQLWEQAGDYTILPRGYSPPFLPGIEGEWEDARPRFERTTQRWVFRKRLRPKQEPAALAMINQPGDKMLCLGCGKGKTSLFLWYACQREVKTLIIVDRDFLVDQWLGEIKKFLWIPADYVGIVQGKQRTVGSRLTIAMVHTLAQQDFDDDFYRQFGLIGVDECHMLGAPTFCSVLPRFAGERILLSATPNRKDGMHPAFLYHGGGLEPCYTDVSRDQSTSWFFLQLPQILTSEEEAGCRIKMRGMNRRILNRPRYETRASQSFEFNRQILDEVMKAAKTGRNVLCLGSRVEQLEMLAGLVGEHFPTGLVTGDIKGRARKEMLKNQVLFITDRIGHRALDVPRLDTLYLLYPTDDADFIRQTVGRVDRELEAKRKPIAIVFCHPTLGRLDNRMEWAIREVDPGANIRRIRR